MNLTETTPDRKPTGTRWLLISAALLVVSIAAVAVFSVSQGRLPFGAPSFNGVLMQSPEPVPDFEMMASTGERVRLSDFHGKPVLLYFGYTYCPDACPTTMNELRKVMEQLGPRADDVQVVMVSVDPERDTPDALREYLANFGATFIGLSGSEEELLSAATPLGVYFRKHDGTPASGYLVDHSTTLMAVDPDGFLRLLYPYETPADAIAEDMRTMMR